MRAEAPAAAAIAAVPSPRPSRRSRQLSQTGPLPTNPFLGAEFRQIGLITTLIVTILIVLTFVLG